LVGCPVCIQTLTDLNLADNFSARLRALQEKGGQVDRAKIDSLIVALRSAVAVTHTTPQADETTTIAPVAPPKGDDSWLSLLSPPQGEGELGRLGGYRVLRVLGHGGMGAVFEAEDPDLHRLIALKVPHRSLMQHPLARERF